MNNIVRTYVSSSRFGGQRMPEPSIETKELLLLGRQQNWGFRVLGWAPMPENPVRVGDWLLAPAEVDSSVIPTRSLARVDAIFEAGIRPQGFVLVHEAPKLLAPTSGQIPAKQTLSGISISEQAALKWIGAAASVVTVVLAAVVGAALIAAAVLALASVLIVPAILAAGALGLDPILVAVTEDGYWIEIDRWLTE